MKLTWTRRALRNLAAIRAYIAEDAPERAIRFTERLVDAAEPLQDFPEMGRLVPEGSGSQREILYKPYRIIYRVEAEGILILAVVHGARKLPSFLHKT